MRIETKFNPGDYCWIMWDNKAINRYIQKITWNMDAQSYSYRPYSGNVSYTFCVPCGSSGSRDAIIEQSQCFKTKEELLASL